MTENFPAPGKLVLGLFTTMGGILLGGLYLRDLNLPKETWIMIEGIFTILLVVAGIGLIAWAFKEGWEA